MTACLSDLRLDELMAGELDAEAAAAARGHLDGCARCRDRDRELTADRARFRAAMPPLRRRRRIAAPAIAAAALASAAGLAVVLHAPAEGTRTKGHARLDLVVVHGDQARRALPGEHVRPGDTLSYLVTTAEPAYVAIVSRDAAGRATTYVPAERVPAAREHQLSIATVLDGSLGAEELAAVFCAEPLAADALNGTLDREPAGCTVDRIDIDKVR